MIQLDLPWPPTVNTYWRRTVRKGRAVQYLSKQAKAYRREVTARVWEAGRPRLGDSRLRVSIVAFPPDRRRRDLDNLTKGVLDSLESAFVFEDDEQVDDLRISRAAPDGEGRLEVRIEVIPAQEAA